MDSASSASNLAHLLHHLAFNLDHQSDQILLEQLGVGFAQFKILMSLQVNPAAGQKELAHSLSQTEASVSRQLKLLRNKGIVMSRINPNNKRQHYTLITTKGQKVTEVAITLLAQQYEKSFAVISPKNQQNLITELSKISKLPGSKFKHEGYRHLWENMV